MRSKTGNGHGLNLERLLEDMRSVVQEGEALLKSGFATVKEQTLEGARATDETVREHPYTSLGVAFGAGIVLGALVTAMITRESRLEQKKED